MKISQNIEVKTELKTLDESEGLDILQWHLLDKRSSGKGARIRKFTKHVPKRSLKETQKRNGKLFTR